MVFVRKIDEQGFFIEDDFVEEVTEFTIETPVPQGFYKPKWNGTEWIEGLTQVEIDAIKANVNIELTIEEKVTKMAEQLLTTQTELEQAQEALDFLIMNGGM